MPERTQLTDNIFVVNSFLSQRECDEYIQLTEDVGYSDAPISTSFGPMLRPDVRNNTRVMLDDLSRSETLWQRARPFVDDWNEVWKPIGLNERLRFYRYDVNQQFNWHYDGAYERENGQRSWLTFMIYLNSGFAGGNTEFEHVSVIPETGMALFFVHDIRHKGQAVARGRKYVLRSDVMYEFLPNS